MKKGDQSHEKETFWPKNQIVIPRSGPFGPAFFNAFKNPGPLIDTVFMEFSNTFI